MESASQALLVQLESAVQGAPNPTGEQAPALQVRPPVQTMPQPPQLLLSVLVLTSQPLAARPSQLAKPGLQEAMAHEDAVQAEVAFGKAHTLPHAPQLLTLAVRFVQVPLQFVNPPVQETWQDPPEQT